MRILRLAFAYLASRPLLTALNVAMLALGVATIAFLLARHAARPRSASRATRSPSTSWWAPRAARCSSSCRRSSTSTSPPATSASRSRGRSRRNPMVASATPVALGDSFRGHRIVGTDESFLALYDARLAQGRDLRRRRWRRSSAPRSRAATASRSGRSSRARTGWPPSGPAHEDASLPGRRHPRADGHRRRPPRDHFRRERLARPRGARAGRGRRSPRSWCATATPLAAAMLPRADQRDHGDAGGLARLRERAAAGPRGRGRGDAAVVRDRPDGERGALPLRRAHLGAPGAALRPRPAAHPRRAPRRARRAHAGRRRDAAGGGRYTGLRSRAWRGARAGTVARRGRHRGRSPGSRGRPGRRCSPRRSSPSGRLPAWYPPCRPISAIPRAFSRNDELHAHGTPSEPSDSPPPRSWSPCSREVRPRSSRRTPRRRRARAASGSVRTPRPPARCRGSCCSRPRRCRRPTRNSVPSFPKEVKELDKQQVKLYGFMMPLDQAKKQKRFLLSAFPPHCSFCLTGGPESLVEVLADQPIDFTFEPVVIAGRMAVLDNDVVYYRLTNAVAGQALRSASDRGPHRDRHPSPEPPGPARAPRRASAPRSSTPPRCRRRRRPPSSTRPTSRPPPRPSSRRTHARPGDAAPTSSRGSCSSTSSRSRRTARSTRRCRCSTRSGSSSRRPPGRAATRPPPTRGARRAASARTSSR